LARFLKKLESERDELRNALAENDAHARRDREDLHAIEESLHKLDLHRQELTLRLEGLTAKAAEQYEVRLSDYAANFVEKDQNWPAMEARVEEVGEKIRRLGPVNVEALDEQTELEIRAEQLKTQESDALKAISDLREIIRRNKEICTTRFTETFEQIRENFHEMFRKLFGSGRADIILEDPANVLECAIEIIAKPPGKEPSALSLMSGGEKALTAVALLFAIFKTKPSPFCIMDEVDAPLDETNIERFVGVLREYTSTTQFLVITHSKRTMAMADCLYGITMEELGVSKPISVRFEDIPEKPAAVTGMHIQMDERKGVKVKTFEVNAQPDNAAGVTTTAKQEDPAAV